MNKSLLHCQNIKVKRNAQPMQAIHINDRVYNVRRDGPWGRVQGRARLRVLKFPWNGFAGLGPTNALSASFF